MPQFDPQDLIPDPTQTGVIPGKGFDPKALVPGAAQVAAETFQANFDPDNFGSTSLRLSLSRGDNLKEKRLRVKKFFPEGDVRVLGASLATGLEDDALFFRESPQSQWKLLEPPGTDFTDIGELIAPSAESLAAEGAIALATAPVTGGLSIPAVVGRQALGAFAGEAVEQGIQSLTGTQAQTTGEILLEPTIEGAASALGGFAMSPLVAAKNIAGGRGALQIGEEGLDVMNAAHRIDPKLSDKLTPGLLTDNPALQLQERQSAALLPGLQRRYRELVKMLDSAVKGNVEPTAFANITQRVTESFKNLSDTFIRRIGRKASPASEGGKALQQGIEEYDLAARKIVDDLYESARQVEEPEFDLAALVNLSRDLKAGAKGTLDPEVRSLLGQIDSLAKRSKTPSDPVILESLGLKHEPPLKPGGPIRLSDGSFVSIGDQLRNVRTGAFSTKNIPPGEVASQKTGQANDLFKAINEALDNPTNPNPAFKAAWKKAASSARTRFETLDQAAVIKVAKSQNPAELVGQFARPGQVGNLQTIRNTVDPGRWKEFTDAFVADVFDDPAQAAAKLKAFDQESLDVLIPRSEQAVLKNIGKELGRITDVGVEQIAERQIRNKNFIGEVVEQANPRRTSTIMRAANETNNKAMRDSLRAGIFDWTWDGIVKQGKKLEINQPLLKSRIEQLKKSGMFGFLPARDQLLLADAEVVARSFRRVIDAGTSIQAAEAAKGIGRLEKGAIRSFVQAGIISHFYLSSAGRRILIGSGLPNSRGPALRLLGGALAQTSRTEDVSQLGEN